VGSTAVEALSGSGAGSNFPPSSPTFTPVEFEKDDPSNHHVDWITAASNLRCAVFKIPALERLAVQRIAGKIIPALATTTCSITGLGVIELYKLVMMKEGLGSLLGVSPALPPCPPNSPASSLLALLCPGGSLHHPGYLVSPGLWGPLKNTNLNFQNGFKMDNFVSQSEPAEPIRSRIPLSSMYPAPFTAHHVLRFQGTRETTYAELLQWMNAQLLGPCRDAAATAPLELTRVYLRTNNILELPKSAAEKREAEVVYIELSRGKSKSKALGKEWKKQPIIKLLEVECKFLLDTKSEKLDIPASGTFPGREFFALDFVAVTPDGDVGLTSSYSDFSQLFPGYAPKKPKEGACNEEFSKLLAEWTKKNDLFRAARFSPPILFSFSSGGL